MSSVLETGTWRIDLLLVWCVCLWLSPEQKQWIKTQFEIMIVSHYLVRVYYSRAAKHGERQWQKVKWKAKDAKRWGNKHHPESVELRRMDKRIFPVTWPSHNDRYLLLRNLETAKPIRKQPCTWGKRRPALRSHERKGRFPENHSQTCSSSTWTRTSECVLSKGRKRAPKTIQWNTASRPWVAQPQLEIPLVAGSILIFNRVVGVCKMARNTPRRMAQPTLDYLFRVQTLANVVHAKAVKTEHLVECTERDTDAPFFSRVSHMW